MGEGGEFPDNRFAALDEALRLIGFSRSEWKSILRVLARAEGVFLKFCVGDISIEYNIGSDFSIEEGAVDWIQMVFRVWRDNVEKRATYTYEMRELKAIARDKKIKIHKRQNLY